MLPCGHTGRRLEAAAGDVLPGPAPTPRTTGSGSRTDRAPVFRSPVVAKLQRYAPVIGLQFLAPLLLTPLIEVPVTAIAARGSAAAWRPAVLVNTLTNPVAVLLFMTLFVRVALWSHSARAVVVLAGAEDGYADDVEVTGYH